MRFVAYLLYFVQHPRLFCSCNPFNPLRPLDLGNGVVDNVISKV